MHCFTHFAVPCCISNGKCPSLSRDFLAIKANKEAIFIAFDHQLAICDNQDNKKFSWPSQETNFARKVRSNEMTINMYLKLRIHIKHFCFKLKYWIWEFHTWQWLNIASWEYWKLPTTEKGLCKLLQAVGALYLHMFWAVITAPIACIHFRAVVWKTVWTMLVFGYSKGAVHSHLIFLVFFSGENMVQWPFKCCHKTTRNWGDLALCPFISYPYKWNSKILFFSYIFTWFVISSIPTTLKWQFLMNLLSRHSYNNIWAWKIGWWPHCQMASLTPQRHNLTLTSNVMKSFRWQTWHCDHFFLSLHHI